MLKTAYVSVAILLVSSSIALASPYAGYNNLEYWAGDQNAPNRATLVVDFAGDGSYAFGFGWSGQATGWDMLSAVCAAGGLDETHSGSAGLGWGVMVNSLSYDGLTIDNDSTSAPGDTWLVYWASTDGNHWSTPPAGVSSNVIGDGDWNGWTATAAGQWPGAAPVPEPATLAIISIGALAMLKRRRGRK